MERFQNVMFSEYQLDPTQFVSLPHFAWNAMLKYTNVQIGLIDDPAMYEMISNGIRGGLCQVVKRYEYFLTIKFFSITLELYYKRVV